MAAECLQCPNSIKGLVGSFVFVFGVSAVPRSKNMSGGGMVEGEWGVILLSARRDFKYHLLLVDTSFNSFNIPRTGNAFWIWVLIVQAVASSFRSEVPVNRELAEADMSTPGTPC